MDDPGKMVKRHGRSHGSGGRAQNIIVVMTHAAKNGESKLLRALYLYR